MKAHLNQPPPAFGEVGVDCPPELEAVIRKALEKEPERRFQSAREFREALAAVPVPAFKQTRLAAQPLEETKPAAAPATRQPASRKLLPWVALAVATVLVTAGLGGWLLLRNPRPEPQAQPAPTAATSPAPRQTTPAQQQTTPAPQQATPAQQQPAAPSEAPSSPPPGLVEAPPAASAVKPPPADVFPAGSRETPPQLRPTPAQPERKKLATPPIEANKPAPAKPEPDLPRAAPPVVDTKPAEPPPAPPRPAIRSLRDVRTVFVARMPNDLDVHIRAEINGQLSDRLSLARNREDADAVLTGESEERSGTGAKVTGGYPGLKDQARGAVTLRDRTGRLELWSGEAGDKSPVFGALQRGGARQAAERLVNSLKKAMKDAR